MTIFWDILNTVSNTYNAVKGIDLGLDTLENTVNGVTSTVTNAVNNTVNGVKSTVNFARDWISSKVDGAIGAVNSASTTIQNRVTQGLNSATATISGLVGSVGDTISNAFRTGANAIQTAITSVVNGASSMLSLGINKISSAIDSTISLARSSVNSAVDFASNQVQRAIDTVKYGLNYAYTLAKGGIDSAISAARSWVDGAINTAKNEASQLASSIQAHLEGAYNRLSSSVGNLAGDIRQGLANLVANVSHTADDIREDLSRRIEAAIHGLVDQIERLGASLLKWLSLVGPMLQHALSVGKESTVGELGPLLKRLQAIFSRLATNQYHSFAEFMTDIEAAGGNADLLRAGLVLLVAIPVITAGVVQAAGPFSQNAQTLAAREARPSLVTPDTAIQAFWKGSISFADYLDHMARLGFRDELSRLMEEASRPLLDPTALRALFLRGEISEAQHDHELAKMGYDANQARYIKALYFFIPPPQDLIQMAVKEAFTPDIAERFGQYEDFPEAFSEWAEKQGVSRDWAKRYWASHWGLPSPQMGFDMLQRGIIDREELKLLLRALDIMPYWRDRLIDLSYTPFTRVDVRRMYQAKVLTREEVKKAYLDIGYNDARAEKLTEFTVRSIDDPEAYAKQEIKNLARSTIEQAYVAGLIDHDEAADRIEELGFAREDADLMLSIRDYQQAAKQTDDRTEALQKKVTDLVFKAYSRRALPAGEAVDVLVGMGWSEDQVKAELSYLDYQAELTLKQSIADQVKTLFMERTITREELVTMLGELGFTGTEIDALQAEMAIVFDLRDKKPTQAQLRAWSRNGWLTPEEYAEELRGLGYNERYIVYFLADAFGGEL